MDGWLTDWVGRASMYHGAVRIGDGLLGGKSCMPCTQYVTPLKTRCPDHAGLCLARGGGGWYRPLHKLQALIEGVASLLLLLLHHQCTGHYPIPASNREQD